MGERWHEATADHTLGARLAHVARARPDAEALSAGAAGRRRTYARFAADVDLLALGLIGKDVRPGERIAVWGTGHADTMLALFAAARIGAVLTYVDPAYDEAGLSYALRTAGAELLFTGSERETRAEKAWDVCPRLRDVFLVEHGERSGWSDPMDLGLQMSHPERVEARAAGVTCRDVALLRFAGPGQATGVGTRGAVVGVASNHHDLLDRAGGTVGALLRRNGAPPDPVPRPDPDAGPRRNPF